jgi:tetratricopeptide (TPR) repeat protein
LVPLIWWRVYASKKAGRSFGEAFERVSPRALRKYATQIHVKEFFQGSRHSERNCLFYIALDLDATRTNLLKEASDALARPGSRARCVEVVGERQQGKTMLLGRLAYDLAEKGELVYWASGAKSGATLRRAEQIASFYRRQQGWAAQRRLYLFVDGVVHPHDTEGAFEVARDDARRTLNTLANLPVTFVVSGVRSVFPPCQQVRVIGYDSQALDVQQNSPLALKPEDRRAIVDKWVEMKSGLTCENAKKLLAEHEHRPRGMLAFLCDSLESAAQNPGYNLMQELESECGRLREPHRSLGSIAACQILDIPVPMSLLPEAASDLREASELVSQQQFEDSPNDWVYVMESPRIARWVLSQKLAVQQFEDLEPAFSALIEKALSIVGFGERPSERNFLRLLLHDLAHDTNQDLLDGSPYDMALRLFRKYRDGIEDYFAASVRTVSARNEAAELINWGWAFKALNAWDLAEEAYSEAQVKLGPDASKADRFRLINGLKALPGGTPRLSALGLIKNLYDALVREGDETQRSRCVLFTTWCEVLLSVGKADRGVQLWIREMKRLEPDAFLYMTMGRLYEALGRYLDARKAFETAVEIAENDEGRLETVITVSHRYAVFLDRQQQAGWPSASVVFSRLRKYGKTPELVREAAVTDEEEPEESVGRFRSVRWIGQAMRRDPRAEYAEARRGGGMDKANAFILLALVLLVLAVLVAMGVLILPLLKASTPLPAFHEAIQTVSARDWPHIFLASASIRLRDHRPLLHRFPGQNTFARAVELIRQRNIPDARLERLHPLIVGRIVL